MLWTSRITTSMVQVTQDRTLPPDLHRFRLRFRWVNLDDAARVRFPVQAM